MNREFEISYKQELRRKAIHMISLSIPIIYSFVTKEFALSILIPLTILSIITDYASRKKSKFRIFYHKLFGKILRPHEYYDVFALNGATWVLISATICVIIFPKILVVTGFSVLIISDICSALIGRRYGKHKIFVDKSFEGMVAFWVSGIIVIFILGLILQAPWTYYAFGVLGVLVGGVAESASTMMRVDDNLAIPISTAIIMWIGSYISLIYWNLSYLDLLL